eukprot:Skav219143  [mRNA]  locus=scaffold1574:731751:733658:+ [translate_table: standard]
MAGPSRQEDEEELPIDFDDEDYESLPCSWSFVIICIIMPYLNGQMNGLLFPAYTLHYQENGWPVVRAGLALSIGFFTRIAAQQMLLRTGFWLVVPLGIVHLTFATLAIFYNTSEWAVFAEIVCVFGIDAALAIEGITFDTFGDSEMKAKQAASITLSVWTLSIALSCTIGGILYDTLGWTGLATYHAVAEGLLVILLCLQPSCRRAFMEFFQRRPREVGADQEDPGDQQVLFSRVLPVESQTMVLPGATEEVEVLTVEEADSDSKIRRSGNSATSAPQRQEIEADERPEGPEADRGRKSKKVRQSQASMLSEKTQKTHRTTTTSRTSKTQNTISSKWSQVSKVSESAQLFSYTYGASSLQPHIVGATGEKKVQRYELELLEEEEADEVEKTQSSPSVPKDVRFPVFLVVLNAFYNNFTYPMEFATFALYFRQVHNWNEATWASLAQTAGDVLAAILIQLLSRVDFYNEDEAGCFMRLLHHFTSSPFNLSFLLLTWIIFNLGMMSPSLVVAIISQTFMGTTYVYSMKWTNDMNLFYSLGDSQVFLTLQVMTKNAEALGGVLAGVLGQVLYTLNPTAPFAFAAALALVVFLLYTAGFYARLGFVDDIELAEAKRARRKGVKRVSSWRADVRQTTMDN